MDTWVHVTVLLVESLAEVQGQRFSKPMVIVACTMGCEEGVPEASHIPTIFLSLSQLGLTLRKSVRCLGFHPCCCHVTARASVGSLIMLVHCTSSV